MGRRASREQPFRPMRTAPTRERRNVPKIEAIGRPVAMTIQVIGAGVAGLTTAIRLLDRGEAVVVHETTSSLGCGAASWLAGGMLAPRCEAATADPFIVRPGLDGIDFWEEHTPVHRRGTLVLAAPRDAADLRSFAFRTEGHEALSADGIASLEPDLEGRFRHGLFFRDEAHLDPRQALESLAGRVEQKGGAVLFQSRVEPSALGREAVVDCRGIAAHAPGLRGVRGEMVLIRSPDVRLSRPVRLLHPRWPIYIVPRGDSVFMVGATMVESERSGPITLRSAVELLSAAFALHPAFAEAEILETGAACRPAFSDNLPRVVCHENVVTFSGLYRHGFLLAPHFSLKAAKAVIDMKELACS